jgi:signal transduction histidine kinase/CheY-like chemotaxis protein
MRAFPFHRRLTRFSLLWVITVPFLIQTILTIAFIGYYSLRTSQKAIDDLAQRLMEDMGDHAQQEIERRLILPNRINESNRVAILNQELDWTDPDQMARHFLSQSYGFQELDFIYFANATGGTVLAGQQVPGQWIIRQNQPFEAGPYYTYRADDQGVRLPAINMQDYDARTRPWYQAARRERQAVWSPIYLFSSRQTLGISASLPVFTTEGRLLGILASDFSLENLNQFLQTLTSVDYETATTVYLMERSGELIASSTDAPTFDISETSEVKRIPAVESQDELIRNSSQQLQALNPDAIPLGHHRLRFNHTAHYFQVNRLQDDQGLDWVMVLVVPEAEFTQEVRESFKITMILFSFAGVASLGFGWLLYRGLLSPITRLCHEAHALTQGNWDFPITSEGSREFEQLSQAFQIMRQQAKDLNEANQELEQATRLKDEFLANMSHELRTPLNAILGMTEGLQEKIFGDVNKQQLKALGTVEKSADHLLALINDILDVAKIESGNITLDYSCVSVQQLCLSSLSFVKQQALKKKIQLQTHIPPHLPDVCVDEIRIRQALLNLLTNAVKFTPEGGTVTLSAAVIAVTDADASRPPHLQIAIADTGIGIAPENISKLFQPFVQVESALNRQYEGTGLGLALVQKIVELHGGQIGLTSELGKGSCFTIDLPYQPDVELDLPAANSSDAHESELTGLPAIAPTAARSTLILLAEDNSANVATISSYLTAKGYCLLCTDNGQEAIDLALFHHPDVIVMDIQMPVLDGLDAIEKIRQQPSLREVPIIALTALAMAGDQERCLVVGADEYLSKPVQLKQLESVIRKLLADRCPQ